MPADPTVEGLRKQSRLASARYRMERLAAASRTLAWTLTDVLFVLLILALLTPVAAWAWGLALDLILLCLGAAIFIYRRHLDRHRLWSRMDIHGKLPDSVLSAGDWEDVTADPWRERQRRETLHHLEKIDWRKVWPVRWPRFLWLPVIISVLLTMMLGVLQHQYTTKSRQTQILQAREEGPVAQEQIKPLEQVFQDWDEAQKIAPSEEMKELLKEIKPLRDQMATGKMTEKELFLKLNEVQARVQAAKDKMEAGSLEPMAKSLAEAVKDLDGMSGLAAALQRKDFAAAQAEAAKAEEKYNSGAAKMPEGAQAQTAADKLGEAAKQAAKDPQASSALSQMQNGVSKNDKNEMSKGMQGLKNSLGQQAQKQGQCKNLSTQLAQLGECKNGMGKSPGAGGIKQGPPTLSLAKSLEPGKGAGTETDPNRTGAATQLDANHQEMKVTGMAGEGASETQTESTMDPHFEKTAGSVNSAQFSAYEKLSEEATQDENLPIANRQMIKRYFQDIRPQGTP